MDKNTENLKTEINSLREQNRQLTKQNSDLRKELETINNSNGMKVLSKYYKIRDFLLPVNSKRRVLIKSIFKFARHFRHNLKLLNKKNLMLVLSYLKRGEFKLLLGKVDRKLSFIEGDIINSTDKKFLYNVLLQTKHEICINKNMVIDILIPIYNAYEYTVKCIHSVLENTDVPYNLILLNDCSTDERISLFINELRDVRAKNLLEIIVIEHKSNLGFVKNINYPLPKMIEFILESGIPYTYFIHDFFCICPSLNLIGKNKMYCYVSDVRTCSLCIKDNDYRYMSNIDNYYLNNIELWRDCFSRLLLGADNVIAPSNSTAEIIKKIYPEVDIIVQEHNINIPIKNTYNKEFCLQKKIRIGIVGAISYIKGYGVLYEMIKKVRQNRDNIEFVVIGYTEVESEKYKSEDNVFTLTGKYDNKKISEILAQYNISFVMLPNVCPETFSYTASEAILSGYPLLTFDIGAAPERIRRYDCGWCVEDICCDAMYEKCVYLSNHREEILAKANNCPKISNKY